MTKKVDIAGETYIVSEDVDFDLLDTENMIEKDLSPESVKSNNISGLTAKQESLFKKQASRPKKVVRPTLKLYLKYAKKHYVFFGEIYSAESVDTSTTYKLIMKNTDAFRFHILSLRAQTKIGNYNKRILYVKSVVTGVDNAGIEFTPPKGKNGVSVQVVDRLKISPKDGRFSYVEIHFASIHWR